MRNNTRLLYSALLGQIAQLNGVPSAENKFSVDSMNRWIRMILARKEPTEREKKLRTLACQFVDECHAYDLRVCSEHGLYGPIPYSTREAMLCTRNAQAGHTLAARSAGRGPSGSFNATPTLPLSPTPTRSCCSIVLRKRQARKTNHRTEQRDRDSATLLGGILFVPDGTKWWSESDRYRYEHKGQARSVSRSMIEAQFGEQVMADLNSPDFAPAILAGTKASLAAETDLAEIRKVAAAAAELSERISKTLDMAAQLADPSPALRKIEVIEKTRAEKALSLLVLEAEAERASCINEISVTDVVRMITRIGREAKETGRSDLLWPVIASLVERVDMDPLTLCGGICYRINFPDFRRDHYIASIEKQKAAFRRPSALLGVPTGIRTPVATVKG